MTGGRIYSRDGFYVDVADPPAKETTPPPPEIRDLARPCEYCQQRSSVMIPKPVQVRYYSSSKGGKKEEKRKWIRLCYDCVYNLGMIDWRHFIK